MSSLLSHAETNSINRITASIAFTVLCYDFLLTISLDVERYWGRPRSWAAFLYFTNRYLQLLNSAPIIYLLFGTMPQRFTINTQRCLKLQLYQQVTGTVTQFVVAMLLVLRTYSMYMCDRKIIYILSTELVAAVVVCLWSSMTAGDLQSHLDLDVTLPVGCIFTLTDTQALHWAITWSGLLLFDVTVFALTLIQTIRMGKSWNGGLFHIIMRDGAVYFGILVICHLSNILTFVAATPSYKGILTTVANVLSSVLAGRMMLNIRDPALIEFPHNWPSEGTALDAVVIA